MTGTKKLLTTALAVATFAAVAAAPAAADPGRGRSIRTPSGSIGRGVSGAARGISNRSIHGGSSRGASRSVSANDFGRGLQNAFRGLGDYNGRSRYGNPYDYRRHDDDMADAYRDAAIANAVVGLVGILVNAAVQPQPVAVATPAYTAAPVVVQPAGHYEVRRTLVREGYYEATQVWVPEYLDQATGTIIAGHYETHKRWVPPVYQETQVWVVH